MTQSFWSIPGFSFAIFYDLIVSGSELVIGDGDGYSDGDWWWWWPECDGDGETWQIVIVIFILIDMNGVLSIWLIFQSCTVPGQAGRGVMGKLKNLHSKVKQLFRFFLFLTFQSFLIFFFDTPRSISFPLYTYIYTHSIHTKNRCVFYIYEYTLQLKKENKIISWNTCFWPKAQFANKAHFINIFPSQFVF